MGTRKRERTMVVGPEGSYRFQTGMVTAALIQRGLLMPQAFDGSARIRDALRGRAEIGVDELEASIDALAAEALGHALVPERVSDLPQVRGTAGMAPFSTNRLLRFALTAGLTPDQAIDLAHLVEGRLRVLGRAIIDEGEAEDIVFGVLAEEFGERERRRYELITSIRLSERPLIVLIGGATGTGKSTVATELAFRLGISQVTSTDMVREAMRSVLSREVVPGLHDHSFRGMALGGQALSDPRERVLAGFRQQADQVAVGLRAIVRRAARESTSMVIEGTHVLPPFHRYVPADARVVVAGLVLALNSKRAHRQRFPQRASAQPQRPSADYLGSFQAVRWIHDDLLAEAEEHGALVVPSSSLDSTVDQVLEVLSRSIDFAPGAPSTTSFQRLEPRTLFLILDGVADRPSTALGGQTPLGAAHLPVLRRLAAAGGQGQVQTGSGGDTPPETDEGLLSLLAGPRDRGGRLGRGLLEALGMGVNVPRDAVVFRGNFATCRGQGEIVDRRAGRIRSGTGDLLAELRDVRLSDGIRGSLTPAHEHRVVVMLRGPGLSDAVSDTDPGSSALDQRVLDAHPKDGSPEAARTSRALKELLVRAREHLAAHPLNAERARQGLAIANCIITRGAASGRELPKPRISPLQAAMVAGCTTAHGVARAVGLQPVTSHAMTANLDTDLGAKFEAAADLLTDRGLVVVHIKGTDIAAHDRRPLEKRDFLERVDKALGAMLEAHPTLAEGLRIVLSADHGTDSSTGDHLPDPVPLLVARWSEEVAEGDEQPFDEQSSASGALGLLLPGELQELLWGA
ncbi:MAG: alkaline phosphatase family protein [Deltaproteobacteria bacterium]|nr:alkaline phosphatase family protein [Deltaproteobacteria bacterium]